jgi:signal transduction histidine kinase
VLLNKTLRSSTLRLALLYIGLFGAAIFGLFGYVYLSTLSHLRERADQEIARESSLLIGAYRQGGRAVAIAAIEQRLSARPLDGWTYLLVDNSLAPLAGNLGRWPAALQGDSGWTTFRSREEPRGTIRAEFQRLPDGSRLLVGRDGGDGFVDTITIGLVGAVALIILLAAAAGISTSRRSVSRIEAINATSREIMRSGLGKRIPRRGTDDEWDELADNLNSMLDRIEELVEANRQVSDNVAHDLRTPLTRMRGRLERAHDQPFDPGRHRIFLSDTIAELDGILSVFSSLLRISQIEAHDHRAGFRPVDLAVLAREVVELFDATAEENDVALDFPDCEPLAIAGDRDLLFDAFSNLLDNAIMHGGHGGAVTVTVGRVAGDAVVGIADRGPGIPPEERKHVLKRFYRLERSRKGPGSGLGLSLVTAVAHLHGASIAMTDNDPGLRVELRFGAATLLTCGTESCQRADAC